jgi:hypothetical protein
LALATKKGPVPKTLLEVARDPRHLRAEMGFFGVVNEPKSNFAFAFPSPAPQSQKALM